MPYKKIIKLMTRDPGQDMVTCLNMFPFKKGISSDLSPAETTLGSTDPGYNKLRITFGSYEKVYIGTTNNTKHITVGEIELCP